MKIYTKFFLIVITAILFCTCKKEPDVSPITLKLTPDNIRAKAGNIITTKLYINSPNNVDSIVMYKTINLVKDASFGTPLVKPTLISGYDYVYTFTYELKPEEVDKLVGFNFHVVDKSGNYAEKDLTVNTMNSGRATIYSRKWKLISRLWTTVNPNAEDLKDCEKDDIYNWKKDSTYNISFGKAACTYDGFNVFDKWWLSDDEKTFTDVYHSIFDPNNITKETYTVVSISSEKLVMYQIIDLSIFGLTDKEKFVYTFEAIP